MTAACVLMAIAAVEVQAAHRRLVVGRPVVAVVTDGIVRKAAAGFACFLFARLVG